MTVPPAPPVKIVESSGRRALWDYFPKRTNDCPGFMWVFDRAYGKTMVKPWVCGSVQHLYEPCGIAKVETEIERLNERFHRVEKLGDELVPREAIYVVEGPYDPVALNQLNQRRFKHGGGYAVIRRYQGQVEGQPSKIHVYADRPYKGTSWPTEDDWERMTPADAIKRVAERSLLLPGVFSARGVQLVTYSGTWEVEAKSKSDEPSRMVVLGLARSEKTFRAAERVMTVITNVALGVTPKVMGEAVTLDMIPPIHRNWWLETTWEVVGSLNAGQAEHDVVSWWISANAVEG